MARTATAAWPAIVLCAALLAGSGLAACCAGVPSNAWCPSGGSSGSAFGPPTTRYDTAAAAAASAAARHGTAGRAVAANVAGYRARR
jgi:hypothetical protein